MSNTVDSSNLGPVFRAVVTTVVPEASHMDEHGWRAAEELVAEMLRERPENQRRQLRLFLRAIEWMPVARYGRRFTALDRERRARFLEWLQEHPLELIRTGFWGLRTLALLGYYGRPETARALGYTPDVRGWEAVR